MDYAIAIPSHRRHELFAEKTLAYLRDTDVDMSRVTVFLSDEQDQKDYASLGLQCIVTGAANVTEKFNAIHTHYDKGTPVFVMEDDVRLVEGVEPKSNKRRPLQALDGLIQRGFDEIPLGGLWGIAPHSNSFYFTGKVKHGLMLVVAHAFGFVSTKDPYLAVRGPSKTDYERTCRYYVKYGEVVRLDWVGPHTNSYTQPGGMQSDLTKGDRAAQELLSCSQLVERFPLLLAHKTKKTSPFAELRFLACKAPPAALAAWQAEHEAKLDVRA